MLDDKADDDRNDRNDTESGETTDQTGFSIAAIAAEVIDVAHEPRPVCCSVRCRFRLGGCWHSAVGQPAVEMSVDDDDLLMITENAK
jgi:hypothetical protein